MARIRTIKPEFFTSEQLVECSTSARLLFVGLWCFSDDGGVHPASIKRLKMEVFPGDAMTDESIQGMVDELLSNGLIVEFEAENQRFWHVSGWDRHQKIDRPTTKYPRPDGQNSTIIRRGLDERSTTPRDGMESNGMEYKYRGPQAVGVSPDDQEKTDDLASRLGELKSDSYEPNLRATLKSGSLPRDRTEPIQTRSAVPPESAGEVVPDEKQSKKSDHKKPKFDPLTIPITGVLDDRQFRESWTDWIRHYSAKKKGYTEQAARRVLRKLEGWGLSRAIAAIEISIERNWEGIYEAAPASVGTDQNSLHRPRSPAPSRIPSMEEELAASRKPPGARS